MKKTKYIFLFIIIFVFAFGLMACRRDSTPSYMVRFDSLCEIEIPSQTVKQGCKVIKPDGLYRENFELEGWYISKDFSEDSRWSFAGHIVTSDMTLYANWTRLPTVGLGYFKLANEEAYEVSAGDATTENDILIASRYNGLPVTRIRTAAFFACGSLISITIPDSVIDIGTRAFMNCSKLKNIEIPDSVTNIGDGAFYNCDSLINIVIPDSVVSIANNAFDSCSNLESITMPGEVTVMGSDAFSSCDKLSIYIDGAPSAGWDANWNRSRQPEIRGCRLPFDKTYVISIVISDKVIVNPQNLIINAPHRNGYTFGGWTTESSDSAEAEYTAEDIKSVPYETKIYAIWIKN